MADSALFRISYGMFVLTVRAGLRDNGCVINTAMQVTDDPERILVALNKKHYTHELLQQSNRLNLSVLSTAASFSLYRQFGFQSGREGDKFVGFEAAKRSQNGLYYLTAGTNAFLSGEIEERRDLGSHTLYVARVTDGEILSGAPSATYQYYREQVKPAAGAGRGYVCRVCGYRYPGEVLPPDFECPICGHGAADFEAVT